MQDKVFTYIWQLLQDYKSRKFILVCGFAVLIVLDNIEGWNINPLYIKYYVNLSALFLVVEGIADIISRFLNNIGGEVADLTVIQNTPTASSDTPHSSD